MDTIQNDTVVQIAYNLTVEGEEVESNLLEYLHGYSNIIPGLEKELTGMSVGDRKQVIAKAADAYGEFDPKMVIDVNRTSFPPDFEIRLGEPMNLRDASGNVFPAVATAVSEDSVELDLNHPMAGKDLDFQVTILSIRPATEDELEHGHIHYSSGCEGYSTSNCGEPGCEGCC
jgi:FKBP-type peptidyl-prolyl cis-trans isomerase SlyD